MYNVIRHDSIYMKFKHGQDEAMMLKEQWFPLGA